MNQMISTRQAMEMLGVGRKLFEKIKGELRPVQYVPRGKIFYSKKDIEAYIERKRKPVYYGGQKFENKCVAEWFNEKEG